jgi:hypothetical protein
MISDALECLRAFRTSPSASAQFFGRVDSSVKNDNSRHLSLASDERFQQLEVTIRRVPSIA